MMNKYLTLFFVLIIPMILMAKGGNKKERSAIRTHAMSFSSKDVGMNIAALHRIDFLVKQGMQAKAFPGCQVLVLKDGNTVYDKCFGYYTYNDKQKVKPTTMYDLASLTKTTATLLAVMKLYDNGSLKLTDKASRYLAFLRGTNKESITISELLFHESGLPAGLPFYELVMERKKPTSFIDSINEATHIVPMGSCTTFQYKNDWVSNVPSKNFTLQVSNGFYLNNRFHQAAMQMIANAPLLNKIYRYSDLNFILLKEIVETISGTPMDQFLNEEFYAPMRLHHIAFMPLQTHEKKDIAPTLKRDYFRNGILQGFVQDPSAAFLGGVSGNAGLFATAKDVANVYQMLLNGGEFDGKRYLSAATCRTFTTTTSPDGRRGLGFDKPVPSNPSHSPCYAFVPPEVFGHTGYTGTCCWIDPVNNLVYVFLSNRTYPFDRENTLMKMGIRTKIQKAIYKSLQQQLIALRQ